jgi:hypothetical protein
MKHRGTTWARKLTGVGTLILAPRIAAFLRAVPWAQNDCRQCFWNKTVNLTRHYSLCGLCCTCVTWPDAWVRRGLFAPSVHWWLLLTFAVCVLLCGVDVF